MARTSKVDWDPIESEYRKGLRSLRDIGEEFGITESAIRRKAKLDGWERDQSAKINAKTEALVNKREHRERVARGEAEDTDAAVIESASEVRADAVWQERKDIRRARNVVNSLFEELEAQIGDSVADLLRLGELMANVDKDGKPDKLNDIYNKIISLPGRTETAKKLCEALEKAINLERKVLRIKDDPEPTATLVLKADPSLSPSDAYLRMIGKK